MSLPPTSTKGAGETTGTTTFGFEFPDANITRTGTSSVLRIKDLPINYISNPNAETATTGWATYADAAGSSPVDGTGGSPTTTFTRSTSSPLRGTANFLITKDAANRQGEGASYAFSIDRADATAGTGPKLQQITCDYEIASGTYGYGTSSTDSDLTCYVYDVTNAVVIQPSGYKFDGGIFRATFQPNSTSTSYRLCFHIATTSSSAWTMKIDNVKVGPQVSALGPAMSDMGGTTWVPTGSWVANTTYTGKWRRVGDFAEYEVQLALSGAPTSTGLTINLPHTIDTAKFAGTGNAASIMLGRGGSLRAAVSNTVLAVTYSTPTTVAVAVSNASGTYTVDNGVTQAVPVTWGNGDYIYLTFRAPISGWSSNTLVSDSATTRVVSMRSNLTSGSQTSTGGWQDVTGWTVAHDTNSTFSSGIYTVVTPGYYRLSANLAFATNATGARGVKFLKNSADVGVGGIATGGSTAATSVTTAITVSAVVGDTFKLQGFQNSGGNLAYLTTDGGSSISIELIQGPSQIAATEVIAAKYTSSVSTSVANSGDTQIPFATKVYDTHGAYSGTVFTAPAPGIYKVSSSIVFSSSTYAVNNNITLKVYKNGSTDITVGVQTAQAAATLVLGVNGTTEVSLNSGDTIDVRAFNNRTAGATTLTGTADQNSVSISRIGGVM